jgi:hypothetical protein
MEKYLQGYSMIFLSSPFHKLQEKDIINYTKSWEKSDKLNEMTTGLNISGDLRTWISVFIRQIYLQPVYYYEAIKKFPDTLPYETRVFERFLYLHDKTKFARAKYDELTQKDYRKLRELLPLEDKKTIQDLRKILFFTENLLSKIPGYLHSSPILTAFIQAIFDLKKLYDIVFPNDGLPLMNMYFKNAYLSQFNVNFIPFEKEFTNDNKKPTFKTKLSETQLKKIFNHLKENKCISENTDYKLFKAVFSGIDYTSNEKIKWILLNRQNKPHKSALRDFLEFVITGKPTQKIINNWFSDAKGNPIELSKPKRGEYGEYSNYLKGFEDALKE